MKLHDRLEDYTKSELLELLNTIIQAQGIDDYQD
jgi:hypothetical protein